MIQLMKWRVCFCLLALIINLYVWSLEEAYDDWLLPKVTVTAPAAAGEVKVIPVNIKEQQKGGGTIMCAIAIEGHFPYYAYVKDVVNNRNSYRL